MQNLDILVIGGGIGGLTAAIALRRKGHRVTVIEKDPDWSVYGVGIIQQGNVIRAMDQLDLLDSYVAAGVPFDKVAVHMPDGTLVAEVPSSRLAEGYPYADDLYDQLVNSPRREKVIFTEREGGVEHVGADNMSYGRDLIVDWFAETLDGRTQENGSR